jgi:glycosyltransferase involved in cell wall biosynthesis
VKTSRLFYISQGNIPSKWAHTFQAMKMAEAFAGQIEDVRILTQGHLLTMLFTRFDFESWYGIQKPLNIVRLPSRGVPLTGIFEDVRYPKFDESAVRYATRKQAQLVYTRSPYAGMLAARAGLPTVIETHMEVDHPEFPKVMEAAKYPSLRGVVTISHELQNLYDQTGLKADILIWPDAVDLDRFNEAPPCSTLRSIFNIPQNAFTAVYCGNLYPDRGVEEIFVAAELLPEVHFVLAGGWDKDIEKRRHQSVHLKNVSFAGFLPNKDLPGLFRAADCLLMPYSANCKTAAWMSPLKMFEYMASGRAIIATNLPAICRHLKDEKNSLLVPPGSGVALSKAIKRLTKNPDLVKRLGKQSRKDVAPFTWESRARAILSQFIG